MKSTGRSGSLSIGELASSFGLATHVLRHWESMGLLAPSRDANGRRRYRDGDRFRVAAVLQAKEAGFTLEDVRVMLASDGVADRRTLLRRHHDELSRRITEAQASLSLIEVALDCKHGDLATCPTFREHLAQRSAP